MTVESQASANYYTGDASTVEFPVTFPYSAASDIQVYVDNIEVTTGWSFIAPNVTFDDPPADGAAVTLYRATATSQLFDADSNANDAALEMQLDLIVMALLDAVAELQSALRVPRSAEETTSFFLPAAADRASKFLAFDVDGNAVVAEGTTAGSAAPFSSFTLSLVALTTYSAWLAALNAVDTTTGTMDAAAIDGDAAVGNDLTVGNNLVVDNDVDISGILTVVGAASAASMDVAGDYKRGGTALPIQRTKTLTPSGFTAGQTVVVAHGLSTTPTRNRISWQLKNVSGGTVLGYAANALADAPGLLGSGHYGFAVVAIDTTNITLRCATNGAAIMNNTVGGGWFAVTPSQWNVVITVDY